MNTFPTLHTPRWGWKTTLTIILTLWLGGVLLLDLVVMPSLYVSGMMTGPGFASAGYTLFGIFNRVELVGGGLVLSGLLAWNYSHHLHLLRSKTVLGFASLLILIPLICLYGLSPLMSSLALPLNLFSQPAIPPMMLPMQSLYWALEGLKLAGIVSLLSVCYRSQSFPT